MQPDAKDGMFAGSAVRITGGTVTASGDITAINADDEITISSPLGIIEPEDGEIYDPASDAWYWLDSVYDGAKATGKEVWMPYMYQDEAGWTEEDRRNLSQLSDEGMKDFVFNAMMNKDGKWLRYDGDGKMMKGWITITGDLAKNYPDQNGNVYYYDRQTGAMAKGWLTIEGTLCHFDEITGERLN